MRNRIFPTIFGEISTKEISFQLFIITFLQMPVKKWKLFLVIHKAKRVLEAIKSILNHIICYHIYINVYLYIYSVFKITPNRLKILNLHSRGVCSSTIEQIELKFPGYISYDNCVCIQSLVSLFQNIESYVSNYTSWCATK